MNEIVLPTKILNIHNNLKNHDEYIYFQEKLYKLLKISKEIGIKYIKLLKNHCIIKNNIFSIFYEYANLHFFGLKKIVFLDTNNKIKYRYDVITKKTNDLFDCMNNLINIANDTYIKIKEKQMIIKGDNDVILDMYNINFCIGYSIGFLNKETDVYDLHIDDIPLIKNTVIYANDRKEIYMNISRDDYLFFLELCSDIRKFYLYPI